MNLQRKQLNFLQHGLTKRKSNKEIDEEADILQRQLRLILHGFPKDIVNVATVDDLRVLEEIDKRNVEEKIEVDSVSVAKGIAMLFEGGKQNGARRLQYIS